MVKTRNTFVVTALAALVLVAILSLVGSAGARDMSSASDPGQDVTYLTGPSEGEPLDIALAYINDNKGALGLSDADLSDLVVTDNYVSKHTGTTHIYLRQRYEGIEVFGANININIAADGSVINMNSSFVSDLAAKVSGKEPALTATEAVEAAADHLELSIAEPLTVESVVGGEERAVVLSDGGISQESIPARLVYQPAKAVRLAWEIQIYELSSLHWWSMRVDAANGNVLSQYDMVISEDWGVNAASGEQASVAAQGASAASSAIPGAQSLAPDSYRVYPIPVESPIHTAPAPPADARVLVPNPANGTASPYGWHDTNGVAGAEFTTTQGNNAHAYTDTNADNSPDAGSSPDGGAGLNFDFPIDLTMAPSAYQPAAVTNLFYWNNLMHDVNYLYGFDEAAGNFQENNYGNGGSGSDYVYAEAQDGSGVNNANFATPPDGSNPRMQMYIWTTAVPNLDGDLDNGIITHEYGHGISNRLVGGPANVLCLNNSEQMGEGWSDWDSLIMTMETGDAGTDARGIGTYALNEPPNGPGIRPSPYSTDLAVNAYTYGDIGGLAIPHGVGFLWATMLWEVNWGLIADHGFNPDIYDPWNTGGNNLAHQLVTDGMKLVTCNPGFVDGRDAILQADQALTGGANQCTIWEAFAKRGLGYSADQGSSGSTGDGTEAFDLPPACSPELTLDKTADPDPVYPGDTMTFTLEATNNTGGTLTGVTITDTVPADTTYVPGSASNGGSQSGGVVTWPAVNVNDGNSIVRTFQVEVDSGLSTSQIFFDDHESGAGNWTASHGPGAIDWSLGTNNPHSPTHAWFADDINSITDQYLATSSSIALSGNPIAHIWHHYDTESTYDGGVIEISTNGSTWNDLGSLMTENGYNSTISTVFGSPIGGRDAFSGNSGGYVETVIDLSGYSGDSVWLRFRMATDNSVSANGWFVDDVQILDQAAIENTACVTANEGDSACDSTVTPVIPRPPTIDVDPSSIDETVPMNTTLVTPLNIHNLGNEDLNWSINEAGSPIATEAGSVIIAESPAIENGNAFNDQAFDPSLVTTGDIQDNRNAVYASGGLTYYNNRPIFDGDNPGLPIEDFEATLVPPAGLGLCPGPVNSSTNNVCFAPGGILDGITFRSTGNDELVVLGDGFIGQPSAVLGPNFFADELNITFTGPDPVFAAGMDLLINVPGNVTISIYGVGDVLLGSTSSPANVPGVFWGVASSDEITRIHIVSPAGNGELVDNVAFGNTACAPDDIPWASVSPNAGTTSGGGTTTVNVTLDASGLSEGDYSGTLCVLSNDPDSPTVEVPVNMTVGDLSLYLPIVLKYTTVNLAEAEQSAGVADFVPVGGLVLLPAMVGIGLVPYLRSRRSRM